jgi:hypothetical protein
MIPGLEQTIPSFQGLLKPRSEIADHHADSYGDAETKFRAFFNNGIESPPTQPIKALCSGIAARLEQAALLHEHAAVRECADGHSRTSGNA